MAAILSSDDDLNIYHLFAASSVIAYTAAPEVNWLVVLDVQTVVFSVKSAGELLIQLCRYLGNRELNTYNIAIAAMGAEIVKVGDLNKSTGPKQRHNFQSHLCQIVINIHNVLLKWAVIL